MQGNARECKEVQNLSILYFSCLKSIVLHENALYLCCVVRGKRRRSPEDRNNQLIYSSLKIAIMSKSQNLPSFLIGPLLNKKTLTMCLNQSAFKYKEIRLLEKAKVYIPIIPVVHKVRVLVEVILGRMFQHKESIFL